jgi:diadenosine tetraphosphate (Ap4A) HIT family hydrolase
MSDLVVEDQADGALSTLTDLERLQDQVLAELDLLAQRIEQVLKEFGRGSSIGGGDVAAGSSPQVDHMPNAGAVDLA